MGQETTSSRLLVLVFTDVVGSTALKDARGHRTAIGILRQHQELVRGLVKEYGGEEIDNHGDGFLLAFERPTSAVLFALWLQNIHRMDPELPKLRIGVHQGEVEVEHSRSDVKPKDVWGMAVDVTSRVCASALPDQILISSSVFNDASSFLSGQSFDFGEVEWTTHGSYHIRGASHPLSLCEAGIKGFSPMAPPEGRSLYRERWSPEAGKGMPHDPKWKLVRELGRGSFGVAWLARHGRMGTRSVFKFCHDPSLLEDFKREMKALDVLSNTRADIARLIDYDFEHPPYYLQLEYAPGGTLKEWADRQGGLESVPLEVRLDVAVQAFRALGIAHEVGVLHKDIKPSNILVRTEGDEHPQIQLADFGMGVVEKEGEGKSIGSGSSSGRRVNYLAPELRGDRLAKASRESDVYSLGVVFYQLVVGDFTRFPEGHGWHGAIEDEVLRQDLASCLTSNPKDRPADSQGVADAIERMEERRAHLDQAKKETFRRAVEPFLERLERQEGERRQRRLLALPVVVALLALAGLIVESMRQQDRRVLANNEITARHVADNVRVRLDGARFLVNGVATRPKLVDAVMAEDWDTTLEALKEGFTGSREEVFTSDIIPPPIDFYSWSFAARDGYIYVREQAGRSSSPYVRRDYAALQQEYEDDPDLLDEYRGLYETNFEYRDWFNGGRPGQIVSGVHVSEPFRSALSGEAILAVSAPVRHPVSNEILGAVLSTITLVDMADMLRSADGEESDESERELIVINDSRQFVIHPDSVFEAVPPSEREAARAGTRPRLWDVPEEGDAHFDGTFYQTPSGVGQYGWTVVIRQTSPGGMLQKAFVQLRHGPLEDPWERVLRVLEFAVLFYLASFLLVPLVYTTVARIRTQKEG